MVFIENKAQGFLDLLPFYLSFFLHRYYPKTNNMNFYCKKNDSHYCENGCHAFL